ncbi:Crp/Fnr family transcriptional regulator [Variovorax sp. M-6]|uniref:Crp/Fnr family transcriptional regulator n=1 Tax=Variovorax sp. M-6 TaxID=3233041 RepID=UPI003F96CDBA
MNKNGDTTATPSAWIEVPHFDWGTLTAQGAPTVRFHKGQTLFSQGDAVTHVHVVEQGRVRLVLLSAAGHEKHMAIVGTHGMVGECSAFLDGRHSVSAVASSDVVARQVERQHLLLCMERDPACLRQVLWLMSVKLRVLAHQNLLLSQATAAQRVVHHLVQLAGTYGEAQAQGVAIRISFTHQEMANIAGLSRVMTSNVLLQLQEQGLIEMVKSHCVIREMQGLRRLALGL